VRVPQGEQGGAASASHRTGRRLRRATAGLVLLVLVAAVASFSFDLGPRWFGLDYPSPVTDPARVGPPPGLSLPAASPVAAVAPVTAARDADPAAVRRAVARLARSPRLGKHVAVQVEQLPDGTVVHRSGPATITPASTLKLLTATAALEAMGPAHRFTTRVVGTPSSPLIVLVGGGDPLLGRTARAGEGAYPARADLDTLSRATARALRAAGRVRVRLGYDTSLFTGPEVNPRWEPSYVPDDVVSRITPLWVDEGREGPGLEARTPDPSASAADLFAASLRRRGITVTGPVAPVVADAGAVDLAVVRGAPLAEVVQHVLEVSDNEGAEVLARQVAVAEGRPASFRGASRAVRAVLARLGVDLTGARIFDGSGLSRQDRVAPGTLVGVLATAGDEERPGLRSAVADLPVAGFTGSLAYRFRSGDPAGLGTVRAKTGTLTGVHGLAGTVTTRDGVLLAFAAVADRVDPVNTLAARALLDEVAAALAGCTCAATP
jgi:D-alanyl-D-alanine carboxypeptidase/D-alanyl-D-alanine-endopeptidase (penicillin-binding protein 4)